MKLEGSNVLDMDLSASNGVIHSVENVVALPVETAPTFPPTLGYLTNTPSYDLL